MISSDKHGYKHTILGWIPKEWDVKHFEDVADIDKFCLNGNTPEDYCFEYISLSDVDSEHFEITTSKQVYKTAPSRARRVVSKGDILMSTVRPTLQGFTYIKEDVKNLIASTGFAVITPKEDDGEYIYQYLFSQYIAKQFYQLLVGSNYPAINSSDVKKLKVIQPTLRERQKIGSVLSTLGEAITITQQLVVQLKQCNKELMQQLLSGKKRLKVFSKPWNEIHLGEAFNERNETGFIKLNLLSVGSLGVYPQAQSEKKDISNTDKSKYKRITPGDIGYNTMRMWQGRSALSSIEGIVSPAYTIATPKEKQHSLFYAYLFKLPVVVNKFFRNSQGLVEDTLNCKFKDFAIVKVEVPEYDEQVAIAAVLSKAIMEVHLHKQKLATLQQQKKGLMQKLLTGEIRVKVED
ncbi:MAG: restriction endonuclease subunit S [Bacteroidia bacterium]|nr:restriction endonuclease subunit S [Bacteroidia bacterium]